MNRAELVAEAKTWILTPYIMRGQLKGIGCDCATLLYCILRDTGMIDPERIPLFSTDWWAHTRTEKYLHELLRHAGRVAEGIMARSMNPEAGNIILCKTAGSHVYNHGAMITSWPMGVHAVKPHVIEVDLTRDPMWAGKECVIFDPFQSGSN